MKTTTLFLPIIFWLLQNHIRHRLSLLAIVVMALGQMPACGDEEECEENPDAEQCSDDSVEVGDSPTGSGGSDNGDDDNIDDGDNGDNGDSLSGTYDILLLITLGTDTLESFIIAEDGTLEAVSSLDAGDYPFDLTVTPDGNYVYVADYQGDEILSYNMNYTTGELTALTAYSPTNITEMYTATVNPAGDKLYVGYDSSSGTKVSVYDIDSEDGSLSNESIYNYGAASIRELRFNPEGDVLFGTTYSASIYSAVVDTTTGAIGAFDNGAGPSSSTYLAIHPSEDLFAAVGNTSASSVQSYTFSTSDASISGATSTSTTDKASGLTFTTDGAYLFASGSYGQEIYGYAVNQTTGSMVTLGGYPLDPGANVWDVEASPDGNYIYAVLPSVINVYAVDSSGDLTLEDTTNITNQGKKAITIRVTD